MAAVAAAILLVLGSGLITFVVVAVTEHAHRRNPEES